MIPLSCIVPKPAVPKTKPLSVRLSVTIPAKLAADVRRVAKERHRTMSRALVDLAERGIQAEAEARHRIRDAYRAASSKKPIPIARPPRATT